MMRWSCLFLLSSCSAQGRRLLSLLLGFASVPLPAAPAVFRGVSCRRLPLGGYATFLAPDACPAPAVKLCLWGLRCLLCGACFQPCAVLFLRHLRFCAAPPTAGDPSGFLPFSGRVCLPYCCAGGVGWGCRPSLVFSMLLLHQLACRFSLGSAPCVRVLPLRLWLLFVWQCGGAL